MNTTSSENFYFVKIKIKSSDSYEKIGVAVVRASSRDSAAQQALEGEAHNELIADESGWHHESDYSFSYFVLDTSLMSDTDAEIVQKYIDY